MGEVAPGADLNSSAAGGAGHLTGRDLAAFLGHALAGAEQRRVEAHLDACPQCRAELVKMFGIAGPLAGAQRARRRSRRIARRWLVSAVVVVCLLALLLVLRLWSPRGAPAASARTPAALDRR